MLKSGLCDCSDPYILVYGTVEVLNLAAANAVKNNGDKNIIFKNCATFTDLA